MNLTRRKSLQLLAGAPLVMAGGLRAADNSKSADEISFALLTDIQYADAAPVGERHYRASLPKLKAAVADLAAQRPAFALHLGDLIDRDVASFDAVLPLLKPLGCPLHHVLGNHDYAIDDAAKAKVLGLLEMPRDYYRVDAPGLRLLMLDTTDQAVYKQVAGSPACKAAQERLARLVATGAANAKPWGGGIGETQMQWLRDELASATAAGVRVLLCGHHPLVPADGHELWNAAPVMELIDRHPCVIASFSGHNHAGAEVVRNGVPYITFKSLLHQPNITAYAMIRLSPDALVIQGRGREVSRRFALHPRA